MQARERAARLTALQGHQEDQVRGPELLAQGWDPTRDLLLARVLGDLLASGEVFPVRGQDSPARGGMVHLNLQRDWTRRRQGLWVCP